VRRFAHNLESRCQPLPVRPYLVAQGCVDDPHVQGSLAGAWPIHELCVEDQVSRCPPPDEACVARLVCSVVVDTPP
jgi:hypothetical protein